MFRWFRADVKVTGMLICLKNHFQRVSGLMWLRLFEGLTQLSAGGDVSSSSVVLQVVCWAAGDGDVRYRRPRRRSDAGPPPPPQQLLSVITAVVSRFFRNHICTSVGRRRRRVALVVRPYYVVFCTASKYRFNLL